MAGLVCVALGRVASTWVRAFLTLARVQGTCSETGLQVPEGRGHVCEYQYLPRPRPRAVGAPGGGGGWWGRAWLGVQATGC